MKLRKSKWLVLNFICLLVLLPFQNCSNKFEGFKTSALNSASSTDTLPNPAGSVTTNLEFLAVPPLTTSDNFAQFVFKKTGSDNQTLTIKCSLDNSALTNCVSPVIYSNLSATNHHLLIQHIDTNNTVTALTYSWTVTAAVVSQPGTATKTIFMGSGHGGRTLMSCDDGLSWINDRYDIGSDTGDHSASASRGMDSGSGYFYANYGWGFNGSLRRSRDGINWDIVHSDNWGGGVANFSNLLFHGAEGGNWYTSNDNGTNWIKIINSTIGNIPDQFDHPSIVRLNNKIFVSGRNQKLGVSSDKGKTWTLVTSGLLGNTSNRTFAEGNGVIVSFSYDYSTNLGNISRSLDDGKTWTGYVLGKEWSQIVFNGSQFIGWSDGKTWKSSDGLNWTNTPTKIDGLDAPPWWTATTQFNPKSGTYVGIITAWNHEYENQKAYRSKDGINWVTLDPTKFKGGTSMHTMIVGEIESKYCP